ncbi:MAG: alcohol dehydrogenase [Deltaproteobacteria bacterium]|nr:alcohol dehydrogenase [Deltaproteobacteria bacterium]
MPSARNTMYAVQVSRAGGPLEMVTRPIPEPAAGEVRVRVEACSICHSDAMAKEGGASSYPRIPGHEIIGRVEKCGTGVVGWTAGQRVGIGWYGGHCGVCERCRRGDFILCARAEVTGLTRDGGYAEYLVVSAQALAAVPDALSSREAAPLLCAGITTFNALRNSGASPGDVVAILGLGGLGHLGVQFASKMGFRTVAIARGADKATFARQLGAEQYIDSAAVDPGLALTELGGARVILATVTASEAMSAVIGGLGHRGLLLIVGASPEPIEVSPLQLIRNRLSVTGWPSGSAIDSEDTLRFSAHFGVRPMIERYPLDRAAEAYDRMMSGEARFRVVLETGA